VPLGTGTCLRAPDRVLISRDINPQWQIETDPAKTSEVEVRFIAEAPERTRVESSTATSIVTATAGRPSAKASTARLDGRYTCTGSPTCWRGELMAPLVSTIEIARPQDEVFAYATDPSTFVEWQEGVVGGSMEGGKTPAVGSKCVTTRRIGGSERPSTSEITKLDPPTSWAVHGIEGPIRAIVNVTVEPLNGKRPLASNDRARFRGTRHRQAASATHRPPAGAQRNARQLPQAQATHRGESHAAL
jgi:hypothetical protein